MLRLKLLCIIFLQLWAQGQTNEAIEASCNDKDVESAVDVALVEYNNKLLHGNQILLYRILKAQKVSNESDAVFVLDFQAREGDCPVGGDKIWRDCNYLPNSSKAPSNCNATVLKSKLEEDQEVLSVSCVNIDEPIVVRKYAPCLGCPEVIDPANEDVKEPLSYSLAKFNAAHNSKYHFVLNEITSATRQVVFGLRYDLKFDVIKSNCSKTDFKELTDECHPTAEDIEFAYCNSTVYVAPWRHEEPEIHVDCTPGLRQSTFIVRRPPGWSPLILHPNLQAVSPLTTTTPSAVPAEQEPLNEPQDNASASSTLPSSNVPGDSTSQLAAEPKRIFNCPSEPWKSEVSNSFRPSVSPSPSIKPSPEVTDFSDLDLL